MDLRIKKIDEEIENSLNIRRNLQEQLSEPGIVETSHAIEFRELRVRRTCHGPLPKWMTNFNAFELFLISSTPKIDVNQVNMEANWLRLKDRISERKNRARRVKQLTAAGVVFCVLLFSGSTIVSKDGSLFPDNGYRKESVYVDKFSDQKIGSDNITDAGRALLAIAAQEDHIVSVQRWALNDEPYFMCETMSVADSISIFRPLLNDDHVIHPELASFLINNSSEFLDVLSNSGIPPYEEETIVIETQRVTFSKWEIRTEQGRISYWKGVPVCR